MTTTSRSKGLRYFKKQEEMWVSILLQKERQRGTSDAIFVSDQYVESVTSLHVMKIHVFDNDSGYNLQASKPRFNPLPNLLQVGLIQEHSNSDPNENSVVSSFKCSHPLCVKLHKFASHAQSCNHSFKKPSLEEKVAKILQMEISNMSCSTTKTWHFQNSDTSDTEDECDYNEIDRYSNVNSLLKPGYSKKTSRTMPPFSSSLEHYMRGKFNEGQLDRAKKAKSLAVAKVLKELVEASINGNDGLFQPQDAITAKQVASYFSRLSKEVKKRAN